MNVGSILKTVAPWIGTAVTSGPAGLASLAMAKLGEAIGGKKVGSAEEAEAAVLGATPEQIVQLKKLDDDFAVQMQQLNVQSVEDLEKLANDDRASARARQVAVKDRTPGALAYAVTIGFFGLLAIMAFCNIPKENQTLLNVMVGSLGTAWVAIITYYFGSSNTHDKATTAQATAAVAK